MTKPVFESFPRIIRILYSLSLLFYLPVCVIAQDSTYFGFEGYMRSGFGVDGKGGPHDVFKAPNSEAKYRLGNEAEAYVEALFKYGFEDDRGALFESNLRLAFVTPTSKSNQFITTTSVREAYARAKGIVGAKPGMTFWAGQRFYDRYDIHLNDYWFRDMSGFGGGFEDLLVGRSAKLSLAYLGGSIDELSSSGSVQPLNEFMLNKTTLDLTLYDIDIGFGSLGVTLDLSNFKGDSVETTDGMFEVSSNTGWSLGLFHVLPFEGGRNLLNVFYGVGAAENYKAVITQPMGIDLSPGEVIDVGGFGRFRILNDLAIDFGPKFSMLGLLMYQKLDNNQPEYNKLDWFSAGIRPSYHFSRYFSLVGELGVDYTQQEGKDQGTLYKLTIAPQISPLNKILSRPALRAYFTYANWSDSFVGQVATGSYADQNKGISFGLQMEVWW
jgi:maltoporin